MALTRIQPSVDLHCHILPGVDDGAQDLDDAIAMGRQAELDGIAAICATPHIRWDHAVRIPELSQRRAQISKALREVRCATKVLQGGELAASALGGLDDSELARVSLGDGGRWILLEPDPGPLDDRLDQVVLELGERGYRAVIAHPERHIGPDLLVRLERLVGEGALVQATAAFLTWDATRGGMLELARAGMIHVLGSDAHSSRAGRPVAIAAALDVLASVDRTAAHLDWIARAAPEAIVAGRELTPPF